ncbi:MULTISPECIES: purine-cytosine permease family protein [unclassified Streptomyces]|uniref:purine-cytosine permease family protein n=1 Tax=unclassified Streptomyces TaxID=2593676 RepID=UPI0016604900|nr:MULTISPECIES: cytosine permease [unclassified Streptomyces]MBD0712157.1 transporter [Streptomyces sp. CBMA291]MBD0713989.1 transporter [Streptomyces sp. CBMA370]
MTTTPAGAAPIAAPPRAAEGHDGIAPVPEAERTSTPGDFGWIWPSAQFSFGTVVLGALPVVFGLGWWASASAIAVGVAVGTALLAPLARFGLRTGTNDPVSSGAHFGVRGRVVGNVVTVVAALGFFSIAVWTGGTAVMVAGHRLFATPTGPGPLTVAMGVTAAAVALVAVRGHETLVRTYKVTAVTGGAVLLGTVLVLAPDFDPGYAGGALALDSVPRTWLLAATTSATVPLSYATFQGDYTRFMPASTPPGRVVRASGVSMFLSSLGALLTGAYVTTLFPVPDGPWLQGLTDAVPGWFAVAVVVFGFAGTLPQAGLCLYAAGLSANSVFWRSSRTAVTTAVALLAAAVLYLGAVVYDAMDAMSAFVTLLLTVVAPWAAVLSVGYALHRGRYDPAALRTFTSGGGGRYWYTGGVNARAVTAFAAGSAVGVLWVDNPLYTGPLTGLTGGVDLSLPASFTIAATLYAVLCRLLPEPPPPPATGP